MAVLRFIAHIIFGISVGLMLSGIVFDYSIFDRCLFILVVGFLLSGCAEFYQAWNYTRIRGGVSKDIFEWNDVLKNSVGVIIGGVLHTWLETGAWVGFGMCCVFVVYAIVQSFRNKHI